MTLRVTAWHAAMQEACLVEWGKVAPNRERAVDVKASTFMAASTLMAE